MSRIALLDLGTNTFHLLIVETDVKPQFKELFRARKFVKLAEDGLERLSKNAWDRGVNTIISFK